MARRTDLVMTNFYEPHLNGRQQKNNPANNTQVLTERMYMRVLSELSMNRFKWEGLPDSIDERFLEMKLFYNALAVFYFDTDYDRYLALQAAGNGGYNMYENPVNFLVTGNSEGGNTSFINKTLSAIDTSKKPAQCVPIWANYSRIPDLDIVLLYSKKLASIDRTIEINVENMRYTKVVTVEENQRLSYVNILRQHAEGQPVIFGTNSMNLGEAVNVFDVGVPVDAVPNLLIARSKLWNDCMTLLGINNSNQDKKERLVSDEVSANDDQIEMTRAIALNARQQAAAAITRRYPELTVTVDFKSSDTTAAKDDTKELGEGDE